MSAPTRQRDIPASIPGFGATLHAEWRKLRFLRSTPIGVALIVALSMAIGFVMTLISDGDSIASAQQDSEYSVIFYSSTLATWAYAYLAAQFVAAEFQGMGESTFTATPRRSRVLSAKLVLVGLGGLIVGLVTSVVTVAVTQGSLASRGIPTLELADPGLLRAITLFLGMSMAVQGLLAACAAVLMRSAAGGVIVIGLLAALPVSLAEFLGTGFATTVPRRLPGAAIESIAGLSAPGSHGYLPPLHAGAWVLGWLLVFATVAFLRLRRTDLR
ncbi:ABC transporter permease [Actinoalloteichus hymeniacidonis]|uniref:ABC-2 family transporter protein n=1 Tax=Actinoalloteichus hymeniacidonis TaxID=340345 RepID=A0AAC9HT66_9PSEU|nr:ABC transporter permease [Actinoalloteichus hymeniacidonis]AOS64025.1 ABC-2 family transporter protein [Actinoalloteichus hymeniacidonis]MBB5907913.1 ABC-2 type transport system permease protein [Actinoalloteichus hymeniacidonis]